MELDFICEREKITKLAYDWCVVKYEVCDFKHFSLFWESSLFQFKYFTLKLC